MKSLLSILNSIDNLPVEMLNRQGKVTTTEAEINRVAAFYDGFLCARKTILSGGNIELYGFHELFSVLGFDEEIPYYRIENLPEKINVVRL